MPGFWNQKVQMVRGDEALAGRDEAIAEPGDHFVLHTPLGPPYPEGFGLLHVAMGCFWGAERIFWQVPGVYTTAVGYGGGYTPNPTYEEVCSGCTGHAETVRIVYDKEAIDLSFLVRCFFEQHDPTQYMGQGNDQGTQYRSAIYVEDDAQLELAGAIKRVYRDELLRAGLGEVRTELFVVDRFYFAEDYHQQYLAKNPTGYCGLQATGVSCPAGALPRP